MFSPADMVLLDYLGVGEAEEKAWECNGSTLPQNISLAQPEGDDTS